MPSPALLPFQTPCISSTACVADTNPCSPMVWACAHQEYVCASVLKSGHTLGQLGSVASPKIFSTGSLASPKIFSTGSVARFSAQVQLQGFRHRFSCKPQDVQHRFSCKSQDIQHIIWNMQLLMILPTKVYLFAVWQSLVKTLVETASCRYETRSHTVCHSFLCRKNTLRRFGWKGAVVGEVCFGVMDLGLTRSLGWWMTIPDPPGPRFFSVKHRLQWGPQQSIFRCKTATCRCSLSLVCMWDIQPPTAFSPSCLT